MLLSSHLSVKRWTGLLRERKMCVGERENSTLKSTEFHYSKVQFLGIFFSSFQKSINSKLSLCGTEEKKNDALNLKKRREREWRGNEKVSERGRKLNKEYILRKFFFIWNINVWCFECIWTKVERESKPETKVDSQERGRERERES